jgi:hypothetical protein
MRKLLFFCIFLFACQKPIKLATYILTLKYDEYDGVGKYNSVVKNDTISAKNDTSAFKKGFGHYSIQITMSKFVDSGRSNPMRKNISFKVLDKNGVNVQEKLSKQFIDSIETKINKQTYQIFKSFENGKPH